MVGDTIADKRAITAVDRNGDYDPLDSSQVYDCESTYKLLSYLIAELSPNDSPDKPKMYRPLSYGGFNRTPTLIPVGEPERIAITSTTNVTLLDTGEIGMLICVENGTGGALNFIVSNGSGDELALSSITANSYSPFAPFAYDNGLFGGKIQGKWSGAAAGSAAIVQKYKLAIINEDNDGV